MVRDEKRALVLLGFHALQRRRQVGELGSANVRIGDDAGILERVAVDREDTYEGCVERKEDARLNLRRS